MTPAGGWQFAAGRFAGGDRDELVGYHPSNGTIWVGTNTGAGFEFAQWATVTPAASWRLYAGRFTGGEVDDILVHHPSNGTLTVGRNTGGGFTFEEWATVSPPGGWTFTVGHFRSGPVADVVGYHPTSGTVWLGANTGGAFALEPWGTVAPPGGWAITAADVTGNGRTDVLAYHPSNGSLWVGRNTGGGLEYEPWYTFSPLANVNTWLAYNGWGGYSKYSGRATLSFLRPCPGASPVGWGFEALHLTRAELWILGWPTGEGYRPDVYSDIDWHNGIDLSTYRCLVIGTHPEYWTTTMYDRLQGYLGSGGSLLYLGGNGIFENGEYATDQTQMVFWAGVDRTGVRTDAMFRRLSPPRSERSLLGVTTERCGAIGTPYVVVEPDPPMFRWTGLAGSKTFGNTGLNTGADNGKASGWEVDTVDGPGARTVPVDCAMDSSPTPDSPLPEGLQIIATEVPEAAGRGADMVFYRHPGGGIVLSAGSLTFGGSLPVDPAIQQILRNALADAGVA